MKFKILTTILYVSFMLFGCSPATVTPGIQASPTETIATATTPSIPSVTVKPSATVEPNFPEGCVILTEVPFNTDSLNGLLVITDFALLNFSSYFLDPKSNQLLDIETRTQISWDTPTTNVSTTKVSPNKKFIQAYLTDKNYDILGTVDQVIKTYDTQGQEDWNRGRWLDNERMFFQYWGYPHGDTIVIYNPFTDEQKNIQLALPNPYIVYESLGKVAWVKADIDPTLKRVLYNDKDERLVLWDLDNQKEIASLPSPMDVTDGTWSPDGKEFAIPSPSTIDAPQEMFIMNMDGAVKMTNVNQKYPFASVSNRPFWSPNGRYIAFWLKISNIPNPNSDKLPQWLAITDTTTLDMQIYCLSPNKPPTGGGGIVWSPDSTQVIVNTDVLSGEAKPILVDLTYLAQAKVDTQGFWVDDWMAP